MLYTVELGVAQSLLDPPGTWQSTLARHTFLSHLSVHAKHDDVDFQDRHHIM